MDEIEREENEGEAQPLDEQTRSRAQCLFECKITLGHQADAPALLRQHAKDMIIHR